MRRTTRLISLLLLSIGSTPAAAAWSPSPLQHLQVSFSAEGALQPAAAIDGQGGAIVVWAEYHSTYPIYTLRAQRISASGVALWSPGGIAVTTSPQGNQNDPQVVSDGLNGVIIAWSENPPAGNLRTRAQRLDANGVAQWSSTGVEIAPTLPNQSEFSMVADGTGGALFAFVNHPNVSETDVLAQYLSSDGMRIWGDGGKVVCAAAGSQRLPAIARGSSGEIGVVWADERNGTEATFAHHLDAFGDTTWIEARQLSNSGTVDPRFIVSDGAAGWIIAWNDGVFGRVQRLHPAGNPVWAAGGLALFTTGTRTIRRIVPDGLGGVIVAARLELVAPIRWRATAQRVTNAGLKAWGVDGVRASTDEHDQDPQVLVADGNGGAATIWWDWRHSIFATALYGQRFDVVGSRRWRMIGNAIDLTLDGVAAFVAVPSGNGGAIAAWNPSEIVAHRIDGSGALGDAVGVGPSEVAVGLALERVAPNPSSNEEALIRFRLPRAADVRVSILDVRGARVRTLENAPREAGPHWVSWNGLNDAGHRVAAGVYSVEVVAGSEQRSQKIVRLD